MQLDKLKLLIIGLGQIGGSIARSLTENKLVLEVHGFDADQSVSRLAKERGYIDVEAESIIDGINKVDLVILATPIRATINLIPQIIDQVKSNQAILDIAGIQSGILEIVNRHNSPINYISGHPIAGNEGIGLESSSSDKFNGATFFFSPAETAEKQWIDIAKKLISAIGAKPMFIDPEKHDLLISITINLPYLIAITLMNLVFRQESSDKEILQLAGGSIKSATRVALSSPELSLDMFLTNTANILETTKDFQKEFSRIVDLLIEQDETTLRNLINRARVQKEKME